MFDVYWYEKNLQGDVVAIYNHAGTKLLTYTYDAWGACYTTNVASSVPSIVTNNPFRYRGYYYDVDLDLYYLNARYYNTGRFISADGYVTIGFFAYYPTSVKVICSCYSVYSLARSYAVTVISEGHSLSALYSTRKLSARPSESIAAMVI